MEKEDRGMVERLLRSWSRVRVRKNKFIRDVADETANIYIIKLLAQYELPNEVACTALACDVPRLKELISRGKIPFHGCNPNRGEGGLSMWGVVIHT